MPYLKTSLFSPWPATHRLAVGVCVTTLLTACSTTSNQMQPDNAWQSSQLNNGLQYHLYQKPDQPIELRFIVHAGALQESEQQYGYAHFLEHMAFNGTKHYQGTDIVTEFEKAGMSFGADLNAFTSHTVTSYTLSLPDEASLAMALTWLRDVGDGIEFAPEEVEKEKGVVLGELRAHHRNEKPAFEQAYEMALGDSVYASYEVLGDKSSIENISIDELKNFYQSWYAPNNSELVVVGDFDRNTVTKAIEQTFDSWSKRPLSQKPAIAEVKVWDNSEQLFDSPEGSTVGNALVSHIRTLGEPDKLSQQEGLYIELVNRLISTRLQERAFEQSLQLVGVGAQSMTIYEQQYSVIYADYNEQDRLRTSEFLAKELASLRDHGLAASELATTLFSYENERDSIDVEEKNTSSASIANYMQSTLIDGEVYQDIKDYKANLSDFIDGVTLEQVNNRVKQLLSSSSLKYVYSAVLDDAISDNERKQLLHSYHLPMLAMMEQPGEAIYVTQAARQLLAPERHGKILEQQQISPDVHYWQLENGVKVWLKQFPQAEKNVYVTYAARGGIKAVKAEYNPAIELAVATYMRSGLGRFNAIEADRFLKENGISLSPILAGSAHGFSMTSVKPSLENAFAALYTAATSVKADAEQLDIVKKNAIANRTQALKAPDGQLIKASREAMYWPNTYYQLSTIDQFKRVNIDQVQALYDQLYRQQYGYGMVIVADMTPQELEPLLTGYIANIQYQDKAAVVSQTAGFNREPGHLKLAISKEDSVLYNQYYSSYFKPSNTSELMQVDLLYYMLESRYRNVLREERSLDYTPGVAISVEDDAEIASVVVSLSLDPEDVEKAREALSFASEQLAEGFSEQELATAKKQVVNALSQQKDSPIAQLTWYQRAILYGYDPEAFNNPNKVLDTVTLSDVNHTYQALTGAKATSFVSEMWPQE